VNHGPTVWVATDAGHWLAFRNANPLPNPKFIPAVRLDFPQHNDDPGVGLD